VINVYLEAMDRLEKVLNERFKLPGFRPLQREIIEGILNRENVIAILATGGGKSLCFQLPALLVGGLTLVISPLVALMEDQMKRVVELGIEGTFLSSVLENEEKRQRLAWLAAGKYQLVFIAPERLNSPDLNKALEKNPPRFIAIDEAHCISQWGHDFRPSYMDIGPFIRRYSIPYRAAFTGTATWETLKDMENALGWEKTCVFKSTFDRPNLKYMAYTFPNSLKKLYAMKGMLSRMSGCGAIYCATRKEVERLYGILKMWGADPCMYHAGLPPNHRGRSQAQWISGQKSLIVATNAFGMGIDKPDVRFVIHYQIPGNLENYYQEAGRAGRDRQSSLCILLFSPEDREIQTSFLSGHHWNPEHILSLMKENKIPDEYPGYLKNYMIHNTAFVSTRPEKVTRDLEQLRSYAALQLNKFKKMERYVVDSTCRRAFILNYFNEKAMFSNCGGCDQCVSWKPKQISTDYLPLSHELETEKKVMMHLYGQIIKKRFYIDLFAGKYRAMIRVLLNHGEKNGPVKEVLPCIWIYHEKKRNNKINKPFLSSEKIQALTPANFPELLLNQCRVMNIRRQKRAAVWKKIRERFPYPFLYPLPSSRVLAEMDSEDEIRSVWPRADEETVKEIRSELNPPPRCLPDRRQNLYSKLREKKIRTINIDRYFFSNY
jgi:ATP-dependent DNA helicase RecQ